MSVNTSIISIQKNYPPTFSDNGEIYYPDTDPNAMPGTDIHFKLIANLVLILEAFLQNQPDANAFGDLMFYYEEGDAKKFVAPDVMICFGIDKQPRRVYKLWENTIPAVIIEVSSDKTWREDLTKKFALYQQLGVREYYIFDPEYKNLRQPLIAFHRVEGEFVEISVNYGRVLSNVLGLELVDTGETVRLFNPETNEFLMTMEEIRAENEMLKAELAKIKQ